MKITKLYHLHTVACNHASLTMKQTIDYAIAHKYRKLVFTEHYPYHDSKIEDEWTTQKSFNSAYNEFIKYKKIYGSKIEMLFGCETEYPVFERKYFDNIKNDKRVQFAIFGNHRYEDIFMHNAENETFATLIAKYNANKSQPTTKKDLKNYFKTTQDAFKSGLFSYFAHPDVWINRWAKWDKTAIKLSKKLIKLSIKYNMVLGFNVYGLYKTEKKKLSIGYPYKLFWELVATYPDAKVIVEADAHKPEGITIECLDHAYKVAISYGLKNNLVEDVNLKLFR